MRRLTRTRPHRHCIIASRGLRDVPRPAVSAQRRSLQRPQDGAEAELDRAGYEQYRGADQRGERKETPVQHPKSIIDSCPSAGRILQIGAADESPGANVDRLKLQVGLIEHLERYSTVFIPVNLCWVTWLTRRSRR